MLRATSPPGDPGILGSCPKSANRLSKGCAWRRELGEAGPRFWQSSAQIGPNSARCRPNVGKFRPMPAKFWPSLDNIGQVRPISASVGQLWPDVHRVRPKFAKRWPNLAKRPAMFGRSGPNFGHTRPKLCSRGNLFDNLCATCWTAPQHAGFALGSFPSRTARNFSATSGDLVILPSPASLQGRRHRNPISGFWGNFGCYPQRQNVGARSAESSSLRHPPRAGGSNHYTFRANNSTSWGESGFSGSLPAGARAAKARQSSRKRKESPHKKVTDQSMCFGETGG